MMKGLELSRAYYEAFGRPMLEAEFPELLPELAVGCVGSGSERYGFDDAVSADHDFEPGFCIFLPGEDVVDRRSAFLLERAYARLPKEFCGYRRQPLSPVGGNRFGVLRTSEFYLAAAGTADGLLSMDAWLRLPDAALAEAVNGEVFYDGCGEFTRIRARLMAMPEDVRRKRIAGNLLLMAQAGPYNFARCLRHGEPEAAQLAATEFTEAAMKVLFLLKGRYLPYYKWRFRALRQLEADSSLPEKLAALLRGDNRERLTQTEKCAIIEEISADTIARLRAEELTKSDSAELEAHAYSVNDGIRDGTVRNLHILAAVE